MEVSLQQQNVQNCNQCWQPITGTTCKTSCYHLFCEVRCVETQTRR